MNKKKVNIDLNPVCEHFYYLTDIKEYKYRNELYRNLLHFLGNPKIYQIRTYDCRKCGNRLVMAEEIRRCSNV